MAGSMVPSPAAASIGAIICVGDDTISGRMLVFRVLLGETMGNPASETMGTASLIYLEQIDLVAVWRKAVYINGPDTIPHVRLKTARTQD